MWDSLAGQPSLFSPCESTGTFSCGYLYAQVEITVFNSHFVGVWPLCQVRLVVQSNLVVGVVGQVRLDPRTIADWAEQATGIFSP